MPNSTNTTKIKFELVETLPPIKHKSQFDEVRAFCQTHPGQWVKSSLTDPSSVAGPKGFSATLREGRVYVRYHGK